MASLEAAAHRHHNCALLLCRRWITNGLSLLTMSLLGEWLCVRRELADIPLSECPLLRSSLRGVGPDAEVMCAASS